MPKIDPEILRERANGTLVSLLGIEITDAGDGVSKGRMKITPNLLAPNGFLHAASVVALWLWNLCRFTGRGRRLHHGGTEIQPYGNRTQGKPDLSRPCQTSGPHHPGLGCGSLFRCKARSSHRPVPVHPDRPLGAECGIGPSTILHCGIR